eukprot:EG_transcript_7357
MALVGALDQGTTSTRFVVYDEALQIVSSHQVEHRQITKEAGWLEHDPEELYANAIICMNHVVSALGERASKICSIGMTNQRETIVAWDKDSGHPLHNAIVWSDLRTSATVEELAVKWGTKDALRASTGLPLSTYFSAVKVRWFLDHVPQVCSAVEEGRCMVGTIDSWLMYRLSGGKAHITDVTNASRTMLMDLHSCQWSPAACSKFDIPLAILPEIRSNCEPYFSIAEGPLKGVPVCSSIGDQQASTVGQACFRPGQAKSTYGSGCFLLSNTGDTPVMSQHGLLTTVCFQISGQAPIYALEGSIANSGTVVQWLRDGLGLIASPAEVETLAASVPDTGGVLFVPALAGLYAPYWRGDARGTILGMTQYTTKAHICRAALQGICCLVREVLEAMELDSGHRVAVLAVDGGMSRNGLMMQMQADLLGAEVVRASNLESTSMGCAMLAGLASGVWSDTEQLVRLVRDRGAGVTWFPQWSPAARQAAVALWRRAVPRSFTGDLQPAGRAEAEVCGGPTAASGSSTAARCLCACHRRHAFPSAHPVPCGLSKLCIAPAALPACAIS